VRRDCDRSVSASSDRDEPETTCDIDDGFQVSLDYASEHGGIHPVPHFQRALGVVQIRICGSRLLRCALSNELCSEDTCSHHGLASGMLPNDKCRLSGK